uniref:Uncharacterized protein n=1 Tax=Emiliania huxleyi TaxID=2903 RepID=A0A7S3W086_EMIHU
MPALGGCRAHETPILLLVILAQQSVVGASADEGPVSFSNKLPLRRAAVHWYCVENKQAANSADLLTTRRHCRRNTQQPAAPLPPPQAHKGETPCLNNGYTQRMQQAATPEERKRVMGQRAAWISRLERKGKRDASRVRSAYLKMYRAYCGSTKQGSAIDQCVEEAIHGTPT